MQDKSNPSFGANMLLLHAAVTRALDVTKKKCLEFTLPSGKPGQTLMDSFVLYVRTMDMVINAHHIGEDEIIFPRLRVKLTQVPFDELYEEHKIMEVILVKLGQIAAAPGEDFLSSLLDTVTRLNKLWLPHIAKERKYLYSPEITAAVMSPEEQIKLFQDTSEHALKQGNPALMLPFVLGNLSPGDRKEFSGYLPPEVTQTLIPAVWKPQWAPMLPFMLE